MSENLASSKCLSLVELGTLEGMGRHSQASVDVVGEWAQFTTQNVWQDNICVAKYEEMNYEEVKENHTFVSNLYNKIIETLRTEYNHRCLVDYSVREWEVIIGPWLKIALDTFTYRWFVIESLSCSDYETVYVLDEKSASQYLGRPDSIVDFKRNYLNNKLWHQFILSDAAKDMFAESKLIDVKQNQNAGNNKVARKWKDLRGLAKPLIRRLQVGLLTNFCNLIGIRKQNSLVLYSHYLSLRHKVDFAKRCSCKVVPYYSFGFEFRVSESEVDLSVLDQLANDKRTEFLIRHVKSCFPRTISSDIARLLFTATRLRLPEKADYIYCGSSPDDDELFRAYIARQVKMGAQFVLSQHGGIYAMSGVPLKGEYFEHRVASKWLSWGWTLDSTPAIKPGFMIQALDAENLGQDRNAKFRNLLIALPSLADPRVRLINRRAEDTVAAINLVLKHLPEEMISSVLIRPKPNGRSRYHESLINIEAEKLDVGTRIEDAIRGSDIFVCVSFTTAYFDAISRNHPTVLLLNSSDLYWRNEIAPDLMVLENHGLLFRNPIELAQHCQKIWMDIPGWWRDTSVQNALNNFRRKYCDNKNVSIRELVMLVEG